MKTIFYAAILSFCIVFIFGCSLDGTYDPRVGNPSVPNSPSPVSNSVNQEVFLQLQWEAEGAVKYTVFLDTQNPPVRIILSDTLLTIVNIYGLEPGTTYYWRVVSTLDDGSESVGDVWNFTTAQRFTASDGTLLQELFSNETLPSNINIIFQALDRSSRGIPNYLKNDFEFFENENPVSDVDGKVMMRKRANMNYILKTVLLIDKTVNPDINYNEIKNAALGFINRLNEQQQIEVYSFSDQITQEQEFSSNITLLSDAVNNIQPAGNKTNLYGAIIYAAERLVELISLEQTIQTSIVFLTYNNDTVEEFTIEDVLNEIIDENVYGIGIGNKLNLGIFSLLTNRETFIIDQLSELEEKLSEFQSLLSDYSNSLYWINYDSPERENKSNNFKIFVKNNPFAGQGSTVEVTYNSNNFYTAGPGLFINSTSINPEGIDSLTMFTTQTRTLTASSFHVDEPAFYTWLISDSAIVKIELVTGENNKVRTIALGSAGEKTNLILTDLNNGLQKILPITIE
jgi:hypothetical protein